MKNVNQFVIVLTASLLMISCEKEEANDLLTIVGTGEIVTKSLDLDPFSHIEFTGVANLYISVGDRQSVQLKAQQNIIDILTWEIMAGTLLIGIEEDIYLQNHEEIRFEIVIPDLRSLIHDGVGDMELTGESREVFDIDHRGVGHMDAYALPIDHCTIISSGIGDCKIQVDSTLEVDISNIGNVYYRGNPQIISNDTGIGNLINDN